ncbi:MAG: response regulator transcription factor [Chloroflexi bacterium]|nr:response regulator transcription factor [Chloroflexota bacterium]
MAKILVVDDEATLVETIKYRLRREGFEVCVALDGLQALEVARREKPDVVLLDIMLPKMDGFEVCRTLRKVTAVPILMLTARDDEVDKVVGLELGADDYVTKPFSMRELMARVRAMLRRAQMSREEATDAAADVPPPIVAGGLVIDLARHRVVQRGKEVTLKPKEFDLLTFLVKYRGQVFSRDVLLQRVWGYEFAGDTRTVDVHVRSLREKIEVDPGEPLHLETVRGVGYRFRE